MFEFIDIEQYHDSIGIYKIENVISGLVYIGQTREGFWKRYNFHRWKLRINNHDNQWLQASFNKYGEDAFRFSVLIEVTNPDELNDLEIQEIAKARESGHCCNVANGGEGAPGVKPSEENIRRLAELNRVYNTGKKASNETKERMSKSHKGKKRPEGFSEKMVQTRHEKILNGEKLVTTKLTPDQVADIKSQLMNNVSWDDLAEQYHISRSNINAIRSNRSWRFIYVDGWDEYCETHKTNTRARQSRSAN